MSKENFSIIHTRYIRLPFEGYFAYRIATDPDPSDETRGMSGYTMALSTEDKLDQVIRLSVDDKYLEKNLRPPGALIGMDVHLRNGIQIKNAVYNGEAYPDCNMVGLTLNLAGANRVFEDGTRSVFDGPTFESSNNITGSDDEYAFAIMPFHLQLKDGDTIFASAKDRLDPRFDAEAQAIWKITDPEVYARRMPIAAVLNDEEVNKAINVFDYYGYFRDRVRFMQDQIKLHEMHLQDGKLSEEDKAEHQTEIEKYKSRIFQIESYGERVFNKLGTKVTWEFAINDEKTASEITLGNGKKLKARTDLDWPIRFWFGGWDGDLLAGYMRGELKIPVEAVK